MKILLVNKYHYVRGGSETYYFGLAELLQKYGHQVIYFSMNDPKNIPCEQSEFFVDNIDFNGDITALQKLTYATKMIYSFEAKKKFEQLIKKENPDIIHINLFHRILTASIIDVAKKYNIPVVFTMHDLNCICPNHTMLDHGKICEACIKGNYWNCVKKTCFKNSKMKCFMAATESKFNKISGLYNKIDLFITPSQFYKQKLLESGITSSKIIHMKNFLPPETNYYNKNSLEGYMLYFGRISYEKGLLTLIKAVEKLNSNIPLYIIGTGPIEKEIKDYIKNKKLNEKIKVLGFKFGNELNNYIDNSKCVILPSEWYENGPYSIMEAMSKGKPVVVSNYGGLPEIVEEGVTGFICKANDSDDLKSCIKKVFDLSSKDYEKMSVNAVIKAKENFNPNDYVKKLITEYSNLITMKRR